jgi:hypothetical protein
MKSWWLQAVKMYRKYALLRFIILCLKCPFSCISFFYLCFYTCCGCFIPLGNIGRWYKKAFRKSADLSLHATTILDAPLPLGGFDELEVVCLPIKASKARWSQHGLILKPVKGQANQYERLGTFGFFLPPSSLPTTKQVFALV